MWIQINDWTFNPSEHADKRKVQKVGQLPWEKAS